MFAPLQSVTNAKRLRRVMDRSRHDFHASQDAYKAALRDRDDTGMRNAHHDAINAGNNADKAVAAYLGVRHIDYIL